MDTDTTTADREPRAREILATVDLRDHIDNMGPLTGRYLLIEDSAHGDGAWATTFDTLEEAGTYLVGQEYPEDWDFRSLTDLDTGQQHTPVHHVTWEPIQQDADA